VKLRIKGNSWLRLLRSEVDRLLEVGRVEEKIQVAPADDASLTYAVEHDHSGRFTSLRRTDREIVAVLPTLDVENWARSEQVGIYESLGLGAEGKLECRSKKVLRALI
jgi:hypothetical protein